MEKNSTDVIFTGYIFDKNVTHAISLCKKHLNIVVFSDILTCIFVEFCKLFYLLYFKFYVMNSDKGEVIQE